MQRRVHPARPWIVYATATVLVAGGVFAFARRITALEPVAGIEWMQSMTGPVVVSVEPGGPAWEAGLLPGDTLLRADGRPVGHILEAAEFPWHLKQGHAAQLEIRRSDEIVLIELEASWRPVTPDAAVYGYLSLVGLAFLVSGGLISIRWPAARGGTVYALLCGAMFALLVYSPTGKADRLDWTVSWIDQVAAALVPALLVHLGLILSKRAWTPRRIGTGSAYAVSVALAVWLVLGGQYRYADPVRALATRDRIQMLFLAVSVGVAALLFMQSYSRSASALHRTQMRWMLWGIGAGLLPFVLFRAVPWALDLQIPEWTRLSIFPLILVPAAFTAAVGRYRLDDLDLVLRRGLTEVTAVFFTGCAPGRWLAERSGKVSRQTGRLRSRRSRGPR